MGAINHKEETTEAGEGVPGKGPRPRTGPRRPPPPGLVGRGLSRTGLSSAESGVDRGSEACSRRRSPRYGPRADHRLRYYGASMAAAMRVLLLPGWDHAAEPKGVGHAYRRRS